MADRKKAMPGCRSCFMPTLRTVVKLLNSVRKDTQDVSFRFQTKVLTHASILGKTVFYKVSVSCFGSWKLGFPNCAVVS